MIGSLWPLLTVNTNGLIVHNTRHSPGRVHDVRVYRMKHPTFPSGLPSRDGSDGKGKNARVRVYSYTAEYNFVNSRQI